MIRLGHHDRNIPASAIADYLDRVKAITRMDWGDRLRGERNDQWFTFGVPETNGGLTVANVQQILKDANFSPDMIVDGIYGYRTQSAIRLFQEYVRTVEGEATIGVPDGVVGSTSFEHLSRWKTNGLKANWTPTIEAWRQGQVDFSTEYAQWISFLNEVKAHRLNDPGLFLRMVNAFPEASDTLRISDWSFEPQDTHLIGIRRARNTSNDLQFDDFILLLIRGLVFKFQGSTEPGKTSHERGAPFLAPGQHHYHFGWHKISQQDRAYLALKPVNASPGNGVLVLRSPGDFILTEDEVRNGALERNHTINVHWGGEGGSKFVKSWSEGCQVITGKGYFNHQNKLVDCSPFIAINSGALGPGKTKGAYNMLTDLAVALGGESAREIKYMLLEERDMALNGHLNSLLEQSREQAGKAL